MGIIWDNHRGRKKSAIGIGEVKEEIRGLKKEINISVGRGEKEVGMVGKRVHRLSGCVLSIGRLL